MKKTKYKINHSFKQWNTLNQNEEYESNFIHQIRFGEFKFYYLLRTSLDDVLIDFQKQKKSSNSKISGEMFDEIWNEILERRLPAKRFFDCETDEEMKVVVKPLMEIEGGTITADISPTPNFLDVLSHLY